MKRLKPKLKLDFSEVDKEKTKHPKFKFGWQKKLANGYHYLYNQYLIRKKIRKIFDVAFEAGRKYMILPQIPLDSKMVEENPERYKNITIDIPIPDLGKDKNGRGS